MFDAMYCLRDSLVLTLATGRDQHAWSNLRKVCWCVLTGVDQSKRGRGVWVVAGKDSHAEGGVCCGGVHRMGQLLHRHIAHRPCPACQHQVS